MLEPQIGYNIYGVSLANVDGYVFKDLTFHGVGIGGGTGYLFAAGNTPLDLNLLLCETIVAHGGLIITLVWV